MPAGDRRRRAAARPTGRAVGVPRVAGRAVRGGLGRRHDAELGGVRAAEDDEARLLPAPGEVARGRRDVPASLSARMPSCAGSPAIGMARSFTRNGTPRNGASAPPCPRRGRRARPPRAHARSGRSSSAFSVGCSASMRVDRRGDELGRRCVAVADELRLRGRVELGQIVAHGGASSVVIRRRRAGDGRPTAAPSRAAPRPGAAGPPGRTPATSWMPIGRPSSFQCSGRLIAGWPLTLNCAVNGTKAAERKNPPSGSSGVESNVPCGTGGSPSVGVSSRSKPVAVRSVRPTTAPRLAVRLHRVGRPRRRAAPRSRDWPISASAQVRISTSSAVTSRPDLLAPVVEEVRAVGGPHRAELHDELLVVEARPAPRPRRCGRATRAASPASSAAATQSGWTGVSPIGFVVWIPIGACPGPRRPRRGTAAAGGARGRGSPGNVPAHRVEHRRRCRAPSG